MSGMELVPIVCLLVPGVAAYWFATPPGLATKEKAPRNESAEIVLPTTAWSPSDVVSLEDTEDTAQKLQSSLRETPQTE
jgi:hypothetical protein